jgi:hypothetical protein
MRVKDRQHGGLPVRRRFDTSQKFKTTKHGGMHLRDTGSPRHDVSERLAVLYVFTGPVARRLRRASCPSVRRSRNFSAWVCRGAMVDAGLAGR